MAWQQYPKDIQVDTAIGPVALAVTERDHIYASYGPIKHGDARLALTVRGIDYSVSIHLYRWADGRFHVGMESQNEYERRSSLFADRANTWTKASEPARGVIAAKVEDAVNAWAELNEDKFEAAQAAHVNNECEHLDAQIAELQDKIAEFEARKAELHATV